MLTADRPTPEPRDEASPRAFLQTKSVFVVVGGAMSDSLRRQVAEGLRPRIDVLELESRLGARVYDFAWLKDQAQRSCSARLALAFAKKTGQWSAALAYAALPFIKSADAVYVTGEDVGYPLAVLLRGRRGRSRPQLVVRLDQPVLGRTIGRRLFSNLYVHQALKRIDRIGCHSNVQVQYLNSVAGVPMSALDLASPKVDTDYFRPDAPRLLQRDFIPGPTYILSAGMEMRDYATLAEAVRGLPVTLVIAAASPWSQFRFEREMPLPPNVTVGRFSALQMRELYRDARFVVVPVKPTLRTCGITVMLESWAMEKGLIASRTVGLLDYASDGENVLFAAPGDPADLRQKIVHLLRYPEEAERLGANGRTRLEDGLNLDAFMTHLEGTLAEVTGHGGAPARESAAG